ncbi:phenylacetate--CoA ligase family protein [Vogesella indigofera]|uniref:phenylacetate--CoA ligase family protein n=1 Tax=Vogesella indigofera TaxID=45465 RepID=UPI00234E88D4|nr:AMP-binding protein [Vogesella indigofera]MDC7696629.1 AMP-binding protein [Vogesella indigofera]
MPYLDTLETRVPAARLAAQLAALPAQIAHAKTHSAAYAALLADIEPAAITSLAALAGLPLTRKSALIAAQQAAPPFGGFAALAPGQAARLFASPGPIYEPQGHGDDFWRLSRALYAAGVRAGDLVHNAFSYHFTPGGFMLDAGARALGCAVFPAGPGQTELQVAALRDLGASAYTGTPSFLKLILEKADQLGVALPRLNKALVSGEALPASLRAWFAARGIAVLQCYATADLGLIAYETAPDQGMVIDEGVLLEIVRPGSGEPLPAGEIGEVVVTSFNRDYPLLRFATGDLSALIDTPSPCGRSNQRIRGWLGRADQSTKIKGMFVHPEQVHAVTQRHPVVRRARLVVTQEQHLDVMTLHAEVGDQHDSDLAANLAATLREVCKLRGEVVLCAPGSLPADGKVIADERSLA